MSKLEWTIYKDVQVGIYDESYTAKVYNDKIVINIPAVKWAGNTGGLHFEKDSIRDQKIVARVLRDIENNNVSGAWAMIGETIGDHYLAGY